MKSSFYLVIPKQNKNPERLQSFKDIALQQWIDELPSANHGLAIQLFYDLLVEINKTEMDAGFRLDAMEVLRPYFQGIEDYLRSRVMNFGFPKSENEQKIFKVLTSVEKEFAIGYWIVAKELTKKSISWLKGREAALAIQRVVRGLSEIIVSFHIMRLPVTDWVWIDLHSLYKLSKRINKSTTKIPDQSCSYSKSITIENAFKQILLLDLVQPRGLRQKEILQIYKFVEKISSSLMFDKKPIEGQKNQCVILTDEDKAPFLAETKDFESVDSEVIFLNFAKISVLLNQKNKLVNKGAARFSAVNIEGSDLEQLPVELIQYIEASWAGIPVIGTDLFADRLDRKFSIGLASTHELISSIDHEADIEFLAVSASDRTLSLKSSNTGLLSIGSLISTRKSDAPETDRNCGIIRKMSMSNLSSDVEFEIQLLSKKINAASYTEMDAEEGDEPKKALFYTAEDEHNDTIYLINESFLLKDGDTIRLNLDGEDFPVVLEGRKNVGLGYWLFECRRRVGEPVEGKKAEKKTGYNFI